MKEIIEKILNEYYLAKKEPFTNHPLGKYFREVIPKAFYNTGIIDSNEYLIKGGVGQGNWATVPWICIFDRSITTSATKGVYIVYLLSSNGESIYLTLNQGCTDIRNSHTKQKTIEIMRKNANDIVSRIDARGFLSDEKISLGNALPDLGELYQKGTIFYKEYRKGVVPSDEELKKDLSDIISIYRDYRDAQKKIFITGRFDSWEILDVNTAIKHCDKSFFDHNGSGIPKDIRWFFDAENLEIGASVSKQFLFNGESYEVRVTNDSTDRLRTRIFWSKQLGDLFKRWQSKESPVAIFRKKQNNTYEIEMKSGEHQMTAKEKVESIKSYIASKGFSYDGSLIENFYLSIKTKPFVILAGTSGTGKTKLVRLFAEAIGANYKLVSVRPDWSDSSDLFGHVDLNGRFNEGVILSFVKDAEIHPNTPFFLCLDEMNLARVEYYLSDILSVIETREMSSDGRIATDPLVPAEVFGTDDKAKGKFGVVSLPDNLYIVGTVNMDETTFPFSKKVLDRANTIEFSYVDLVPDFGETGIEAQPQTLLNDFLKTRYLILKRDCAEEAEYVTEKCEKLQAINEILKEADAHIGYRVRDEIVFYMLNNRNDGLLSEEEALDNEIMQKILPRVQGGSSAVKNMLLKLFVYLAGDYSGYADGKATYEQMRSFLENKGTSYPRSAEKIMYMVRRYEEDGFTSYWL